MIGYVIAVLLCGWGHIVRDGEPSFKKLLAPTNPLYHLSTQLARFTGASICTVGLCFSFSLQTAAILGLAILIGFYTDSKHGEGQGAATLKDVMYLTISGITSILPLVCVLAYNYGLYALAYMVVGLVKPAIWFTTAPFPKFFAKLNAYTTEVAAGIFGALIGLAMVIYAQIS